MQYASVVVAYLVKSWESLTQYRVKAVLITSVKCY